MLILREKREVGEEDVERGPPVSGGGGSEREGARAVDRCGRRRALGRWALALGQMASWAGWGAPGPNPVSVQAAVSVCVCVFFKQNTKVVIINSKELIKTPQ